MPSLKTLHRKIHGLDCAEEVALLKRELVPLVADPERLSFDLLRAKLTIDLHGTKLTAEQIDAAIARTGLRYEPWRDETLDSMHASKPWWRTRRGVLTVVSATCAATGWWLQTMGDSLRPSAITMTVYLIGILAGLILVLPKAWRSLVSLRPDMNLLMSIAVIGAIAINEWFEAATVAFLFSLSLLLESWSVGQARRAIHTLLNLSPPIARVINEHGEVTETPPRDVAVGKILQVRAGDKIPLDGVVSSGASVVDQSAITGESVPVEKNVGDALFAGTINGDGVLTMQSTRLSDDSAVAKIVRLVSEAGSKRATSEQWVEKFAGIYTPIVFALALLIMFVPPLFFAASWSDWIYRALVLLVIACPCALVISTPVSVVAALTSAARRGVLIKGGVFIELPASLDAIAFDKTGTLTRGTPTVAHCVVMPSEHPDASLAPDELLAIAAALAAASTHPLSRAINDYAAAHHVRPITAQGVTSVPGKGTIAEIKGKSMWLGSTRFLNDKQIASSDVDLHLATEMYRDQSVVLIGDSQRVIGFFTLSDPVREHAAEAVTALREFGIETLSMLTGDRESTAQTIANQVGIDDVHSQLLPEDKVEVIGLMVQEYGRVAMVGDGINDAPALAIASLGIAMGGSGTDVAMETADITFMSDDLRLMPWLCSHSKRTLRIIRQNIAFALSIKFLFVLLTIFGMASLWAAIAADTGASLLVIFNALRLLHTDDPH